MYVCSDAVDQKNLAHWGLVGITFGRPHSPQQAAALADVRWNQRRNYRHLRNTTVLVTYIWRNSEVMIVYLRSMDCIQTKYAKY